MKMEQTECSETSAYIRVIQRPGITKKKEYRLVDDTTKDLTEHVKKARAGCNWLTVRPNVQLL